MVFAYKRVTVQSIFTLLKSLYRRPSYISVRKCLFTVSIQGQEILQDFDITKEANEIGKEIIKSFTTMVDGTQEIHFQQGDEGTKMIPQIGVYGPLISAVTLWPGTADLLPSLKQIKATTNNFDPTNKLVGLMETQSQGKYQTSLGIG
ncbi:probable leucine-rich repeat receptor-like serine/threonine-protein kinase At3g14840 isoform X10 [Elaeis guineensis]|uniref:probable leucine-rich repeat receptor-like serine/threonine-protein kinase At3g14840 isoform X10 n=1 Tax=Elaeis guineensis var. tenera TaxID=51953 RepID=UPI003C6D4718